MSAEVVVPTGNLLPIIPASKSFSSSQDEVLRGLEIGLFKMSKGVQELPIVNTAEREFLDITAKLFLGHDSRSDYVLQAYEKTVGALGSKTIDTFLISLLPSTDPSSDSFHSVWQALESLVDDQKVRYIGVCDFSYEQLQQLLEFARISPSVNQIRTQCSKFRQCNNCQPTPPLSRLAELCENKKIELLGHNCSDDQLFEGLTLPSVFEDNGMSPLRAIPWTLRYTVAIRHRALVLYRGYFINCQLQ